MYSSAFGTTDRITLRSFSSAARCSGPSAARYSSMFVGYGLAAFRLDGQPVAGMGAAANHCAYYPMSGSVVATLKDELQNYETSKGAVRFSAKKPLPAALVRKLIQARIAEIGVPATPARTRSRSSAK